MKKIILIVCACCFTFLVGCKSKEEKVIDKAMELCEEYILNLNNATTIEEVQKIRKEHKERVSFESRKILGVSSDDEVERILKAYETKFEWNEIQNFERFASKVEEAEKNAIKRVNSY